MRVLHVQHVAWEGPHRIARAFDDAGFTPVACRPLAGDRLPAVDDVDAAVFMGGPMNVDETERYPALRDERAWLAQAVAAGLPVLGVCLGSQLIARACGAAVRPGVAKELGWLPVELRAEDDPVLGALAADGARELSVLHWHGDIFDLPSGAQALAASAATAVQAFRVGNAWATLFHPEADAELVEVWLAEPSMRDEAVEALGADALERLREGAARHGAALRRVSQAAFEAFAAFAAERVRVA